ncbi:meigo [Symbiodinium natans]|uniref:Meigo protein n=1 Tax=Symbiodinium natans TaxID=878477 RepID=A0A812PDF3_9DINO|nr:meigo [Symbiodinium natans]
MGLPDNAQEGQARQENGHVRKSPDRLKLLKGAVGIYFFFIWYGRIQERIFKFKTSTGRRFTAVWFLQMVDALMNMAVGYVGRHVQGSTAGLPQEFLVAAGVGQVLSKYCTSAALAAGLSFSVATLAKSAKMLPVMIGSLFLGQAEFTLRQYVQAAFIVAGTSIVSLTEGRSKKAGGSSKIGLLFITCALCCDGVVGGVQKRLKVECRKTDQQVRPYDLMFWTNLYMAITSFLFALRAELREGVIFCLANPNFAQQVIKLSVCGALGQASVFYTIANFDSVVCAAVTTTRKLMSVLISVLEGDGLPPMGWLGIGVSSIGIAGELQ